MTTVPEHPATCPKVCVCICAKCVHPVGVFLAVPHCGGPECSREAVAAKAGTLNLQPGWLERQGKTCADNVARLAQIFPGAVAAQAGTKEPAGTFDAIREAWVMKEVDFEHECVTLSFRHAEWIDACLLLAGAVAGTKEEPCISHTVIGEVVSAPAAFAGVNTSMYDGSRFAKSLMKSQNESGAGAGTNKKHPLHPSFCPCADCVAERYAEAVVGTPPSEPDEELVKEIGRELYDRFVMGGWQPPEAYPYIRDWMARARQSPSRTQGAGFVGLAPQAGDPMPSCSACGAALVPKGWLLEDELPEDYPYDEMFLHSRLGPDNRGGCRVFPKSFECLSCGGETRPSGGEKEQG